MITSWQPAIRPEFMPLSLLKAVWKGKFLVVLVWVLISVAVYVKVSQLPAVYSAEAAILVDAQKIPHDYFSSTVRGGGQDRLQSISRQILSTERLKKLIKEMDLFPGARASENIPDGLVDAIRAGIRVDPDKGVSGGMPSFRVSYTGGDPRMVADIANRLAAFFVEENLKDREYQAQGTAEFIEMQLKEAKKRLDELETTISQYKIQHGGELPEQQAALLGGLGRLQSELQVNSDGINRARQNKLILENSLELAEGTLNSLSRNVPNEVRPAPAGAATPAAPTNAYEPPKNPELEKLRAQLSTLVIRYSDDHPDVKRLRFTIQKMEQQEAENERRESELLARQPKPAPTPAKETAPLTPTPRPAQRPSPAWLQAKERVESLQAQHALIEKELATRAEDEGRIRREMAKVQARIDRMPIREQEMAQILRDYDISKGTYQGLLGKKISAGMATEMERRQKSERFTIIDPARIPRIPIKPKRNVLYAMGSAIGLAIGLALAVGKEFQRNVLLGEWELPPGTVVIGTLPKIQFDAKFWGRGRPAGLAGRVAIWSTAVLLLAIGGYVFMQRF